VTVPLVGDLRDENDEQFTLNLSSPLGAAIADGQGVATILDDDPEPGLAVADVSVTEIDSGTIYAIFTVSLSAASGKTVTVLYATAPGTALANIDYTPRSGTLSFAAGTLTRTVSVPVRADLLDEDAETFSLVLSSPVNATIVDGSGTATIADNDPEPTVSVGDAAAILEGHSGLRALSFAVTLSRASGKVVTVEYATADGSATAADGDYAPAASTVTFAPGQITAAVTVAVNGDTADEADETLLLGLTGASNAVLADAQGQGTIRNDDDPPPDASITDVTVTEGTSLTRTAATFTVTLAAPVVVPVTIDFATANGTAVASGDYSARTGRLTFPAGTVSMPLTVSVVGDTRDEMDEQFFVSLTAASGAVIADGQGIGTILDDDPLPSLIIGDATVVEGHTGTRSLALTVTLSAASGQTVTVSYATADGPIGAGAAAPADYVARTGTLVFAPGQITKTVTVSVRGDLVPEDDETFFVDLGAPINATLADGRGQATIVDDEP
jgi:hypothetical protein